MMLSNVPESTAPVRDDSSIHGLRVDVVIGSDTTITAVDIGPSGAQPGMRSPPPGASGPSPGPGLHAT